jgi:energy-coupling factor transporter ATP-binding protein EcfA2
MAFEKPLSVEEICNKLRPIYGKKVDEIYFRYAIAESKEEKEDIAHLLNTLYQKKLSQLLDKGVLLEPPREEQMVGEYTLATVVYAKKKLFPFTLRERDWPRHVCVTGMSGSGKTTLAFNIVDSFLKQNKAFLIFDWKKSFRPLIAQSNQIILFTIGDDRVSNLFKTNINQPPKGVAPKEWINFLTDLLIESFSASFGVHKVILETLDEAFKEWGIYNGSENYPTWNHIKWRLEQKMQESKLGRESGWLESALRIATVMTFGEFGKTVNYKGKRSFTVEDLLNKKVIMELNALGNIEKKFFCEFVLTYIYKLKKARQNDANHGFDHAIIVDEAHNIFLKKPTNFSNESVTDMIYREMREYGTSLICLDQHISKISDTVKGNSACSIAFQQQLPDDIHDVSELMQLHDKRHFFSELPVGSAIVKLSERYTLPFLIEVPNAVIRNKKVTDEDIKERMQAMMLNDDYEKKVDPEFNEQIEEPDKHIKKQKLNQTVQEILYDFVKEYLEAGVELEDIEKILEQNKDVGKYTSSDIMEVINKVFDRQLKKKDGQEKETDIKEKSQMPEETLLVEKSVEKSELKLSDDEKKFVEFLIKNPNHEFSTTEVYRMIDLSPRKGTNVKKSLEDKKVIKIQEIKYDKGWKKFIRLRQSFIDTYINKKIESAS